MFKCKRLTDISIILECEINWSQDDISLMIKHYFQQYSFIKKIEWLQGADIEAVRFKWHGHDFLLSFECLGQSIWVECPEQNSTALLASLYQEMD